MRVLVRAFNFTRLLGHYMQLACSAVGATGRMSVLKYFNANFHFFFLFNSRKVLLYFSEIYNSFIFSNIFNLI